MRKNTVIAAGVEAEQSEFEQVESDGLVTIGELAREGFGPVDVLMRELAALVCVPSAAARALLEERAAAEERRREQRRRRAEERAKRPRPVRGGVPAVDGLTALESMATASGGDEDERRKDAAAAKTAALLRGESFGERYTIGGE